MSDEGIELRKSPDYYNPDFKHFPEKAMVDSGLYSDVYMRLIKKRKNA